MSDVPAYRCSPSVAATQVDDASTVLLHLSEQTYFQLNETGTQLWQHVDEQGGATLNELVSALDGRHDDVSRSDIRTDVESFVERLTQADLLVEA